MILALDPSLRMTGWVLVNGGRFLHCGTIATEPSEKKLRLFAGDDDSRRCRILLDALEDIVTTKGVTELIAEQPSGARGAGGHKCGLCSCGKAGICQNCGKRVGCGGNHVPGIYRSAKAEGMVLALITAFAANGGFDIHWVQPTDVKFALLKARSGPKEAMVAAATKLVGPGMEFPKARLRLEAVADAVGVAVAGGALR